MKAILTALLIAVTFLVFCLLGIGAFGFILTKLNEIHSALGGIFILIIIVTVIFVETAVMARITKK